MTSKPCVTGTVEIGGIAVPALPDAKPAPHWSLEAIAATERPRHPAVHGDKIAFILDRESSDVWVFDDELVRMTVDRAIAPFWEDDGPTWSPDGTTIAYVRDSAVWLTTGELPRRLCEGSTPVWIDDDRLIVGVEHDDHTMLGLVHCANGWPQQITTPPGDFGEVAVAPNRTDVACVRSPRDDLNSSRIVVIDLLTNHHRELPGPAACHDRGPAWSPDGNTILFSSEESGWYEVYRWDLDTDVRVRLTTSEADFTDLAWSEHGVVAVRTKHGVSDLVLIDPTSAAPVTLLMAGGVWSHPQWASSGTIVAAHESPTSAPRLVRVALDATVEQIIAPTPASVRNAPHVEPVHIWYSAPGGDVPGFLLRPEGASAASPCAAIVHPHGGPTGHYGAEWDAIGQYFVDKGYAWLAPNFKGSTSYGRDHERADHGVWGVADTADCLAAHEWLSAQDWVDARRIGIFGASYGSYMALTAVIERDAFTCAVAKYGDCDILTSWAQGDRVGRLDLERMMGHPADNHDSYRAGSPIHRVERISAPILIAHGELDERVHPAQSEELVAALRRIGATYEYVTYPTEGHGFLQREPFLDFYRRLERFLDWYLL